MSLELITWNRPGAVPVVVAGHLPVRSELVQLESEGGGQLRSTVLKSLLTRGSKSEMRVMSRIFLIAIK